MASQQILPADRIRELSAISDDAAAMLEAAGKAINALTNRPLTSGDQDSEMDNGIKSDDNLEARKEIFTNNVQTYYNGLQAIVARLRRQVYALEEAGIIEAEPPSFTPAAPSRPQQSPVNVPSASGGAASASSAEGERITNGGLGNLDVGYLNSRGNKVGTVKEAELVQDAKALLEQIVRT
ncbi:Hypothetical protein R9X50_00018700 [Acrodontium crateriforme]|uniref:Mediator of RNA polymerase II transcription subunit 11 n=1 Tax=Acrodontium crateriforme TaxID=150365 RepID=A0AAQ3LZV6_9PEZI|nr:Hypothetical protein R9X50_00018700 [Acrodontium crateriforme]